MVRACAAYGCTNRYVKGGTLSFHSFPLKNKELCIKWISALQRESFTPTKHTVICSDHFLPSDYNFCPDGKDFSEIKPCLNQNAVPSIFICNVYKKIHKRKVLLKRSSPSCSMTINIQNNIIENVSFPFELKENAPSPPSQESECSHIKDEPASDSDSPDLPSTYDVSETIEGCQMENKTALDECFSTCVKSSSTQVSENSFQNQSLDHDLLHDDHQLKVNPFMENHNLTPRLFDTESTTARVEPLKDGRNVQCTNIHGQVRKAEEENLNLLKTVEIANQKLRKAIKSSSAKGKLFTNCTMRNQGKFARELLKGKASILKLLIVLPSGVDNPFKMENDRRKHNECQICLERFMYLSILNCHIRSHRFVYSYKCNVCCRKFTHPFHRLVHKRINHFRMNYPYFHINRGCKNDATESTFQCQNCTQRFYNKFYFDLHRNRCKYRCLCYTHVKQRTVSPNKKKRDGMSVKKLYRCYYCDKTFSLFYSLKHHRRIHISAAPYLCEVCSEQFSSFKTFEKHSKTHSYKKPHICISCYKMFSDRSNLAKHFRIHQPNKCFKCDFCFKVLTSHVILKEHMNTHTGNKPYMCEYCVKQFSRYKALSEHLKLHLSEKPKCSICLKHFSTAGNLKRHIRTHNKEKPFLCIICCKRFSQLDSLIVHEKRHRGERLFKCEHCSKSFYSDNGLYMHKRLHQNSYTCELCFKQCQSKSQLAVHRRYHTGERPFRCAVCGKDFVSRVALNVHSKLHSSSFECEVCHSRFAHYNSLESHHRAVHRREQPFQCDICLRKFSWYANLARHKKTHSGLKPFKCTVCAKDFTKDDNLKAHMNIHTGEKPYKCSTCQRSFAHPSTLNHHLRLHKRKSLTDINN